MNVKNRKCIRKLSLKSLYANRSRNLIAIFAIALTTLLFTSMFTIVSVSYTHLDVYKRQTLNWVTVRCSSVLPRSPRSTSVYPAFRMK